MAWSQTHRLPQERDRTQTPPKHQDKGLLPKHSLSGNPKEGNYERVRETDNQETWDPRQEAALGVTLQTGFRGLVQGRGAGGRDEAGLAGNSDLAVGGGTPRKDFSSGTRPSDLYSRRSRHKGDGLGVGKTGYYGCPREK